MCFTDGVSLSKFQVFVLNQIFPFFFGISSSGLAYDGKSTKISQILRFRLIYLYRLNRYLGNSWSDFSCQFLEYNISNYNYFNLCPWCVCVHARCTWSCNSANHAHRPWTWIWSLPEYLVCYLKLVPFFCLDFMAFWRLPSQPNVVLDLFYSLHPSWRRLGSSLVIHTWCFVVVNISLFNIIFI